MHGAIPPLPNMSSWPCAQLRKAEGQLYLYLSILIPLSYVPVSKLRKEFEHLFINTDKECKILW
jgi:hypothetical protein